MVLSMPSCCLSMHRKARARYCAYLDLLQNSNRGEPGGCSAAEEGEWENKELMSIHVLSSFGWSSLDNGKEKGRNKQTPKASHHAKKPTVQDSFRMPHWVSAQFWPGDPLYFSTEVNCPITLMPQDFQGNDFSNHPQSNTCLAILFLARPTPREVPTLGTAVDGRHHQNISSALCLLRPLPSSFSANSSLVALPNLSGNSSFTVAPFPLIVMPWPSPPPFPLPLAPCLFAKPRMLTPSPPDGGMDVVDVGRAVIRSASFAVCEGLLSMKWSVGYITRLCLLGGVGGWMVAGLGWSLEKESAHTACQNRGVVHLVHLCLATQSG